MLKPKSLLLDIIYLTFILGDFVSDVLLLVCSCKWSNYSMFVFLSQESSTSTTKPYLRSEWNKASEIQGKAKAIKDSSNDTRDNIEKLKLLEASDQIFKMLNRDYDLRPRRHPPVHN